MKQQTSGRGRAKPAAGPSTRDRILKASLQLFNRHGVRKVPLAMIASQIGISPGNLGYHFKTKSDIVIALFPALAEKMREVKRPDGPFDPKAAARNWIEVFQTLWQYRFFFNGLIQLLSEDRDLLTRYRELEDDVITTQAQLYDELILQKYMQAPMAPVTTRILARNSWMIWLSWLRFEQLENPKSQQVRKAAIYEGWLQNFSVIERYFEPAFIRQILAEVRIALDQPA